MANITLYTRDPVKALRGLADVPRGVRAILMANLTDVQYRRLALLYGFDGPAMSQRAAAEVEGVAQPTVKESHDAALEKLRDNGYLWLLWLLTSSNPISSDLGENGPHPSGGSPDPLQSDFQPDRFGGYELRPGEDKYESDSPDAGNLPTVEEAYTDGWLAEREGLGRRANPYRDNDLRAAWREGWDEARATREPST